MGGNSILNKAKHSENTDEWYTDRKTIEKEVINYKQQLIGKVVLCNCDNPYKSEFVKYFVKNFDKLGLKKLISTSYSGNNQLNLFDEDINENTAYVFELETYPFETDEVTYDEVDEYLHNTANINYLKGNGDFKSEECIEYLKQSDIVITNPPFSEFKNLFSLLEIYDKDYLLISNQNAITYKEIFPSIKNGTSRVGYHFGDMAFKVPKETPPRKTRFWVDESGQKWRSLGNAMWLTSLEVKKSLKKLHLKSRYKEEAYPKYDQFDAIHVRKVAEIPVDYDGIMGVPLTYLKYHNEEVFEIVGEANHGSDNEYDLFKPSINGKDTFKRILIRKRKKEKAKFRILDLFCGAGGMSYGLHKNPNFETKVALDINEKLAQTFKANMPDTKVIIGDIRELSVKEEIIELSKQNDINMIVGGPPCQGFSLKGKKLGLEDPRNFLFVEYLKIVQELQPQIFLIENVKNLMSTSQGWFKNQIIQEITQMGYYVEVDVLKASDYGVPQNRERVFFICSKEKKISLPTPRKGTSYVTVREAIGDLAYLNSNEGEFEQEYVTTAHSSYQKMMRKCSVKLYNHKASNHSKIAIEKLSMIPPEKGKECLPKELHVKQKFSSTWGRLVWDEPSPTIDTRFDAASNGKNNHPFLNRSITAREAARLQSFDDKFIFYGNKVDIRTQIGNAVPPLLSKAIADQIENEYLN